MEIKRAHLIDIENKKEAISLVLERNEGKKKMVDPIHFPFIAVCTENSAENKILVKSNENKTYMGVFVTKDIKISGDTDLLVKMNLHHKKHN